MKRSELRKLVEQYNLLKRKPYHHNVQRRLEEIAHRYYHETGEHLTKL